jgi:probable F420-dependent oxidoreductase
VHLGLALPQFGALAHQASESARFARQAEELGADSLWVGDRVLVAVTPTVGYGGSATIPAAFHSVVDPLTLLAIAAAVTHRVRLGTNVLIAPWYAPVLLARALTAIDVVSDGRLVAGLGTGWSPEEYRAVGAPWNRRGRRLDECLDVLEATWTTNPVKHAGEVWTIPAAYVNLKPAQRPRPPIYLAGSTAAALSRIGRRADGWLPVGIAPRRVMPAMLTERLAVIREAAERAGRDPDAIGAILRVNALAGTELQALADDLRTVEQETGIDKIFVDLMYLARDVDEALDLAGRLLTLVRTR